MSPRPGPGARCGVRWPIRLALLNVDGFAVDVSSACPGGLHRPARLAIGTILDLCEDIGASLHDASRPEGTPTDWVPMHGDLFPGNLRRFSGGRVVLLDWEAAGWAPPHADLVHYVRTASKGTELAARLPAHVRRGCAEAVRFWADRAGDLPEGAPRWMVRRRDAEDAAAAAILAS